MKKGQYRVFNKQGGAENTTPPIKIGLNTENAITSFNKTDGTAPNRVADMMTLKMIANEEVNGPIPLNKTSHYGDVTGKIEAQTSFSYGGARPKKPARKSAVKKTTSSTKCSKTKSKGKK
jgi:hypothetical protein